MPKLNKQINLGVALVMIVMIIPGFFVFPKAEKITDKAVSTVKTKKISPTSFWTSLPIKAASAKTITVYSDVNLTKKVSEIPAESPLILEKIEGKSIKLSSGNYISASKTQVISDVTLSQKDENQTVYTNKTLKVYESPVTSYNQDVLTNLTGNQQLQANQIAETYWGTYYEISLADGRKGWVSASDSSLENPKLQAVQQLLNQKYNNPKYSIYVKQVDGEFTVGVNQNEQMYSASLSKLPILYWTQKRLNSGLASLNDQLLYAPIINTFYGSFEPEGTGTLPKIANGQSYSLQDVITHTAEFSDNVGSNLLAYYETNQFDASYQKAITKIAGSPWNPKTREASAQMVGKVLEALYHEGGTSFNALFNTAFDNVKIKAGVPANVPVAHKIGDADSDNHDAAVVFASEPYILVVETDGGSDQQIQQISQDVYGVLK